MRAATRARTAWQSARRTFLRWCCGRVSVSVRVRVSFRVRVRVRMKHAADACHALGIKYR